MVVSNMFYFRPYLGRWSILTNIFQRGWNHHLVSTHTHTHLPAQVFVAFVCQEPGYVWTTPGYVRLLVVRSRTEAPCKNPAELARSFSKKNYHLECSLCFQLWFWWYVLYLISCITVWCLNIFQITHFQYMYMIQTINTTINYQLILLSSITNSLSSWLGGRGWVKIASTRNSEVPCSPQTSMVFFQHPIWKSTPLTKTKWFSPLVHVGIFHIHRCQASALKPQSYGTWGTTGPKVPNAPWPCVRRTQCSWYNRALELDRIEQKSQLFAFTKVVKQHQC